MKAAIRTATATLIMCCTSLGATEASSAPAMTTITAAATPAGPDLLLPAGQISGIPPPLLQERGEWTEKWPVLTMDSLKFGVYDPHGDFGLDQTIDIQHFFLPWEDVDPSSITYAYRYAHTRGRSLLLTVEPWTWAKDARIVPQDLLAGILANRYDDNIAAICNTVAGLGGPVTIRWGHEMEDAQGRYPWAKWHPEEFKAAYRKFVSECRKYARNVLYMWSPKGQPKLTDYYPGDDVVDFIGLPIFGLQQFDQDHFGRDRSFSEVLQRKYDLVSAFHPPVVVVELGYEGDLNYVRDWAESVAIPHPAFPKLVGVVYFNDKEVYPWPDGYGYPDWRVVRGTGN